MRNDAFLMTIQFSKWNHFSVIYHERKKRKQEICAYDKTNFNITSYDAQQREIEKMRRRNEHFN